MYSRMDKYHGQKVQRFSIRKYSFGAASVAVAAYMMFGGAATVQAQEPGTSATVTSEQVNSDAGNQADSTKPVASTETSTSTVEAQTAEQLATPAPEAAPAETPEAAEAPAEASKAEEVPAAKADISKLEAAIVRLEAALEKASSTEKTASAIESAKAELANAKVVVANEAATKEEVAKATSAVNGKAFVIESMPKATADKKEEKENKNQDPRNGKAIPGNGESGFRADTFIVNESNTTTVPDTTTTGTDKFTFVAIPENDSRRKNKVIAIAGGNAGDIEVKGTGNAPTDLEIEMYSSQRTGKQENPVAMSTVNGQPVTSPGRMDYPLSKEQVQKLQEEAKLWRNKLKPDGNSISNNPATVFGSSGAYEFLATEIYKMGYEQGVDRAYIPNISNRFAVTDKAKEAGWKIKSISPTNLPSGLIYDKESDSIQGRVVSNVQNGVQDLRFTVEAENEKTHQIVSMEFKNLRSGWIAWQDSKPPRLEVSDDAYETQVGKNVNIDISYKDDAGSNFSGDRQRVNYKLASGKVVTIPNQQFRQAVSGLAGYATTKKAGELDGTKTSIPGISYSLAQDGTPVETDENGDQSVYGKGKLSGTATTAGIYTVSVYAKDYNTTQRSDSTWIHSGHEVQKYITVVVKPTITVKNVHAYATTIPVTISDGASTAEVKLPNGKITKLEVRDGQWVVASGTTNEKAVQGTALGQVGSEINIPVSEEDTKDASTDTISAKAITENVKATLLRNEVSLTDKSGVHKARLDETTGNWELENNYKEVKESTPDGGYKLTKRQVFTEVQTDGTINYYIYSYTRTYKANDEIVSVNEVRRDKTVVPRLNTENQEGNAVVVEYNPVTQTWTSSDNSRVTATKEGNFWNIRTESGFTGLVKGSIAESDDKASILNNAPTATSTSYTTVKGATVDLVKQASAAVTIRDTEDDATTSPKKETTITKVTVTSPSGQQSEYTDLEQAKAHLLSEVGTYTVKVEVKDSNGNIVTADSDTATGTNEGDNTAIASTTYGITVKDQVTNKLYTVEDDTVTSDQLKEKVTPTEVDGFTTTKNDITDIPTTAGKAGQTLPTPATVTYTKGTETISVATKVDVVVLPKVTPEGVKVLKDSTGLEEVVKAKATEAATATTKLPDGVTVRVKEIKAGTVPATTATGVQTPATAVVEYVKDGNVVKTSEVPVPVTVVGSTSSNVVVFEGDTVEAKTVQDAVTPGTGGTKGEPAIPEDLTKTTGKKEVTVPVTYDNGKLTETVKVPVTVLPKPEADEILVPKNGNKEKAKEKVLAQAEKAIADGTFTGKLPQGARVEIDKTAPVTVPDLTDDTEVDVTVKYTVDGEVKTTTVTVPVTVVEGVPQIVPVDENNKQPDPEKSIDKTDYPEGSTFRYKTPDGQTSPIDVTTTGDKNVIVEVLDKDGNPIAEVPATVRVVESYPQFVPVDKDNKQPAVEGSIDPKAFPKETEFSYETPVDTTTPGEKDVVVVAKIGDKVIAKVPAKVMVVEPKTQYVPVDKSNKQPDASKSVDPEQYPDGVTFKYKTPVDTTTLGEKDVIVEAKDGEDKLVEVPAKVKVVEGKEQLIPVNPTEKPQARDSITPSDYPEGSTFEYKVPEGQKEPFDATTVGDKPVTVVVKDKNGNVLVEVPATIKVVEAKPTPIETPVTNTPLTKEDIAKFVKVPEGGKVTNVENIPDLTTPGEKDPVKVTVELPNGKVITVDVPVNVTPVNEIETPVTNTPLTPEDYTKGITIPEGGKVTNVENIPDLTTPGKKDPVKVTVELPNGKVITVDIPVNVTPVNEIETPVTNTPLTPEDYTKGIKIPEGGKVTNVENIPDLTTPGKKDPVKVTVELPNGKTITVDVPVNVTPVKEIETPVTNTPLTPEDYTKGIKIPEGGKVTNVENIPDLTTPGKKDPVKVTVELPNGKVITVEVPVNVTPVKEIETPVTSTPLTPEDYTKGIKIPEGGKVTNVENIPDLTTPGKKDPVKVTVELPNGKVITVEVPVNVTPVKEIETPVTSTPLTPEDYTKGIKIPEGGKVTNVENIPDLTTPGKKDPVKVTITLPNGKVVTVEVPVNVTPITPIETPITKEKLTPEDVLKQIKIPEGATVKVGDLPDLTTPGKKDPVKVTITLPNGKIVTVEVPVNVTPIEDIVKKQGDPITAEDVEKHIPKGVKVISIGDKPTTDIPGERPSIPVVIELPNGIRVTMDIPVIVTPKVTPVVVPVGTPVTPEDVKKHIELPKGWTVTKVGEIPTTTTPGTKPVVPVEIELPDGRKITVDVPVIVTPTVRQIVVPQGTPITPDDVKGHIDLPKEPGWEIVEVGEIPTTIPAGVKPSVKVKIKVPTGEIIEVDVPVIVTPKVTPIVVEVGTPITEDDVKKKVDLPEGWEIVEVGKIPTTETPGAKPVVKVKVKLPDGRIITVEVPVTVTPKSQNGGGVISQNGDSTVQIVTEYLDENGNRITSDKEGKHNPIELEGYEFSHSTTDAKGNTLHHYKKVKKPINQEQPSSPETPTSPEKPVATPVQTSSTDSKPVAVETAEANDKKELPNTGTEANASLAALGLLGALGGFGLLARKKKED
ncbi:Rib/alpha-like domain-containing protein [Streptococcus mitis]|uniref:Rib/alpha-like domain-containing protein n=3 Tax=Streptococcus mitis TaxID=28037 RepID=UPI0039F0AC90